ncbi:MAG TPA: hypothetical protein VGD65_17615 [Chryseosolibacter sp.]
MELDKVLFVIVLFEQNLKRSRAFQSLLPLSTEHVFVYDNSAAPCPDVPDSISYCHDCSNPGVSRAYNKAFLFAEERGFEFVLLMDQDSFFPRETLESYRHAVASYPHIHVFAPIAHDGRHVYSPFHLVNGHGKQMHKPKAGIYSLKRMSVINSGLMVSVHAYKQSGGYDESFPLDFSDIDFCERLGNNQFDICIIDGVILHNHSSAGKISRSRFDSYLKALVRFKKLSRQHVAYWSALPRAIKLSIQWRDSWFLARLFKGPV